MRQRVRTKAKVILEWQPYENLTTARRMFGNRACVFVQTDPDGHPLHVGKAPRGLGAFLKGDLAYTTDAAMHGSGNRVFVAEVEAAQCAGVHRALAWQV